MSLGKGRQKVLSAILPASIKKCNKSLEIFFSSSSSSPVIESYTNKAVLALLLFPFMSTVSISAKGRAQKARKESSGNLLVL